MSSLKSIIQDVKGELGSISRRGFDVRFGLRSRSQRVVQDNSPLAVAVDALGQSYWANMPPELLREVLMRIDASGETWPIRKNVVACAGVCRSWRQMMKDIVRTPEISTKLTFPISLKQPGPRNSLLHCYLKRNRSNNTYYLYLNSNQVSNVDGKFLLAARKFRRPTCTEFIITLNSVDIAKEGSTYVGKLRSNFLGTKFTIYDAQPPKSGATVLKSRSIRLINIKHIYPKIPVGYYPVAHISYELNGLGSRAPRKMHCIMDTIPACSLEVGGVVPTQTELLVSCPDTSPSTSFVRSKSTRVDNFHSGPLTEPKDEMLVLKNKDPTWHQQRQCWCLNFHGRVTVASVKNFQLVAYPNHDNIILQFGKVDRDLYTMDYRYPISTFQAFAMCLTSFDTKIARE
ncbi:hypothetical protein SAY87_025169 [Trapa incisa]|uniref:Tubby-like F-box protein 3 n=1 Tax=Trapa incisa TaxID=236973 RepID=A0AAN7GAU3_9MYRT|nr:hypothetical protein SAY87_025169 [Trapa incisa]